MFSSFVILLLLSKLAATLAEETCICDEEDEERIFLVDETTEWMDFYSPRSFDCSNNQSCPYKIIAPAEHHLLIDIPYYRSQPHPNRIYFYDESGKLLAEMTGYDAQIMTVESIGNEVTMIFENNGPISKRPFKIAYISVENDPRKKDKHLFLGITLAWLAVVLILVLFVLYKTCQIKNKGSYCLYPHNLNNSLFQESNI